MVSCRWSGISSSGVSPHLPLLCLIPNPACFPRHLRPINLHRPFPSSSQIRPISTVHFHFLTFIVPFLEKDTPSTLHCFVPKEKIIHTKLKLNQYPFLKNQFLILSKLSFHFTILYLSLNLEANFSFILV